MSNIQNSPKDKDERPDAAKKAAPVAVSLETIGPNVKMLHHLAQTSKAVIKNKS